MKTHLSQSFLKIIELFIFLRLLSVQSIYIIHDIVKLLELIELDQYFHQKQKHTQMNHGLMKMAC